MRTSQISKLYLAKTKNLKHENIFFQPNHSRELKSGTAGGRNNSLKKTFFNLHFALRLARTGTNKKGFFCRNSSSFVCKELGGQECSEESGRCRWAGQRGRRKAAGVNKYFNWGLMCVDCRNMAIALVFLCCSNQHCTLSGARITSRCLRREAASQVPRFPAY